MRAPRFRARGFAGLCLAALLAASGCLRQKVVVQVNPDGTGWIAVSRLFSRDAASWIEAQMREMREMRGDMERSGAAGEVRADPFFSEEMLRGEAALYGEGVELVKAEPLGTGGARGSAALYRFSNINQVRLPVGEGGQGITAAALAMQHGGDAESFGAFGEEDAIEFALARGTPNRLVVRLPPALVETMREARANRPAGGETAGVDKEWMGPETDAKDVLQSLALVPVARAPGASREMEFPPYLSGAGSSKDAARKMLGGMRVSAAVEVRGEVARAGASHPVKDRPGRFALYDFDLDQAAETGGIGAAAARGPEGLLDLVSAAGALPGIIAETNAEMMIEFR